MGEKKYTISITHLPSLRSTHCLTIFATLTIITTFIVFTIDDSSAKIIVLILSSSRTFLALKSQKSLPLNTSKNIQNSCNIDDSIKITSLVPRLSPVNVSSNVDSSPTIPSLPPQMSLTNVSSKVENSTKNSSLTPQRNPNNVFTKDETIRRSILNWVSIELKQNYSSNLLSRWLAPGGEPCKDSQTHDIKFLNIDDSKAISFTTGFSHEIIFQALDEHGNPHCQGGDYFEIDLSGELWKSRPPMKDYGNGTYSFTLQIEPHFAGKYTMTIILLFRHFKGLSISPKRFAVDKRLRSLRVTFTWTDVKLPELATCKKSDFMRGFWAGRWTRHAKNDTCQISHDGRYRCLDAKFPCTTPWCKGSLGSLESNGWVYSAHCSFELLTCDDAWKCLNHRWLFLWGDSNHIDTIRNIIFFILDVPVPPITRRFDMNITNPRDESKWIRITNIFNGHWDDKSNYLGLNSLSNKGYRELLKGYFIGPVVPDTVIFNSGLHDAVHWPSIRRFVGGAQYAANFWKDLMDGVKQRGLNVPNFILRSTITVGGYARTLAFNPNKIEAINDILLEKMRDAGIVTGIVDNFDMTWAWHYDNRCNDGVHYGRFPAKLKWRDGQIGHQYFVDLMLGHVLLNAVCDI